MFEPEPAQFDSEIAAMCEYLRGLTEEQMEEEMERCQEIFQRRKEEKRAAQAAEGTGAQ